MMMGDWRDLQSRCFAVLEGPLPEGGVLSHALWRELAAHPCYREELTTTARRVVAEHGAAWDMADDIEQEALLLLARDLRRRPHLSARLGEDAAGFRRWMRAVITHHCREALRALRRAPAREVGIADQDIPIDLIPHLDERMDVYSALQGLTQVESSVVQLYALGFSFHEIAAATELPYQTAYSIWRRAVVRLQQSLGRSRRD